MLTTTRRLPGWLTVLAGAGLALAVAAVRAEKPLRDVAAQDLSGSAPTAERLREGTRLVNASGYFKLTGDRITFYLDQGDRRLQVLENLSLERIGALVGETPDPLEWTVSGLVTEYGGGNYLLVQQATLKSRAAAKER